MIQLFTFALSDLLPGSSAGLAASPFVSPAISLIAVAGLSSVWMLGWVAAAAIPLVLHLLNRRHQKPIPWAAMQLLRQVIEQESRRMQIEQFLLLALRMLILIVLSIALARPFLTSVADSGATATRAPQLWIVAIDTSYSMSYREEGQSRFETARQLAIDLLNEESRPGDAFALVALGRPARAVIGTPTFDVEGMIAELRRLTPDDSGSELTSGLSLLADLAGAASDLAELGPRTRIAIYTDLGRDTWQDATEGADRNRLQQLRNQHQLDIEVVGQSSRENAYIKSMRLSTSRAMAGNALSVDVVVGSAGSSIDRLPVQLELDGQTVASEIVRLESGGEQMVRLQFVPRSLGTFAITAVIPDDRLSVDNRRHQILEVREQYRVLIVEDQAGDSRLLKLALQPSPNIAMGNNVSSRTKTEFASLDLSGWDVVIMNDLSSLSGEVANRLARFVAAQGSLIWLIGPNANRNAINGNPVLTNELLGFRLTEPSPMEDWGIDPLEYRSPIVAPFVGFPDSGLLTTPIFRFWQIEPVEAEGLQVDLATNTGQPLIVRHRTGQGWVASMLTVPQAGTAEREVWNVMATWPSFLPLVQQLVQVVLDTGGDRTSIAVGDVIQGVVRQAIERAQIKIVRPDRSENQIVTESTPVNGGLPWLYDQTLDSGVYRAIALTGVEQLYAVNIDATQSRLESVEIGQLPRAVDGAIAEGPPTLTGATVVSSDDQLARVLLALLFVLLVGESLLAWAMGRRLA